MENKFEIASRIKARFTTKKGDISVEDLWDIPLTSSTGFSLDDIAKSLNKELKESQEESFVKKATKKNQLLQLKFDIVKYIIGIKLEEKEKKENEIVKKQEVEKLERLIEQKENEALMSTDLETLKKKLNDLKS